MCYLHKLDNTQGEVTYALLFDICWRGLKPPQLLDKNIILTGTIYSSCFIKSRFPNALSPFLCYDMR